MGLYHLSNPQKIKFVHLWWKINVDYLRSRMKETVNLLGMLDWPQLATTQLHLKGEFTNENS